jgi:hypothetical protein
MAFDTRIRNKFRASLAESVLDEFDSFSNSRFFLFFGKNSQWSNENRPDLVIDCVRSDLDIWTDMIGAIRIGRSDVCLVIPRNPWQSGTVYTEYDDVVDLANPYSPKQFYVTTSENKVYKCISNEGGNPSLEQPTSTSTSIFCTSDGYRWKFMYQIPDDMYYKFATDTRIPVEFIEDGFNFAGGLSNVRSLQLAVQKTAIDGGINHVILTSLGDSFPLTSIGMNQLVAIPARVGDTKVWVTPAGLPVGGNLNSEGGLVGYSIYFKSGLGSGQIYEIQFAEWGQPATPYAGLLGLTIREPLIRPVSASGENRTGFDIVPTAKVFGDGFGCELLCKMEAITGTDCNNTYQIDQIEILREGKNYTNATVVIGPVSVRAPAARVIISPRGGHGSDAITELGASEIMISSSSRAGIAGNLPAMNNFRQFGIIRNPKLGRGAYAGQYAGSEDLEGFKLRITKPRTIVVKIKFWATDGIAGRHTYDPYTGNYVHGQLVKQAISGATGRVVRWIPPVAVSSENCCIAITGPNPTGYLYIEPLGDSVFQNDSTLSIVGLNNQGEEVGPTYTHFQEEDNFITTLGYTSESFDVGKFVIGVNSLTTGKIASWEVGTDGTDGYLILSNVNGRFRGATVNALGEFVEGERIVQVSGVDEFSGVWSGTNISSTGVRETNIGIVSGDPQRETITRSSYTQTYKVNAKVLNNNPSITDLSGVSYLSLDSTIDILELITGTEGTTNAEYRKIGSASVVDYTITQSVSEQAVSLELTSLRGWDRSFDLFDSTTKEGILLGFGTSESGQPVFILTVDEIPISNNIPSITRADVTEPDLQINSGEIVYIDNIRAITRNPERLEEFKLILRF